MPTINANDAQLSSNEMGGGTGINNNKTPQNDWILPVMITAGILLATIIISLLRS